MPGTGGALNSLVDAGWSAGFPMTMGNGITLNDPPGKLLGVGSWQFTNWEFDCEGYGNRRIYDHPVYSNTSGHEIDIGGDELDLQIAVGYRFATTFFDSATTIPPSQNPFDNQYIQGGVAAVITRLLASLP